MRKGKEGIAIGRYVRYAVDNIRVSNSIPEPTSVVLFTLVGATMFFQARRHHIPAAKNLADLRAKFLFL